MLIGLHNLAAKHSNLLTSIRIARENPVVVAEKWKHLREMKGPRPPPAEDHSLPASFINHPIAFQTARDTDRFPFHRISCNQTRIRSRTEASRARDRVGRDELDNAKSVFAIGDEGKL